MNKKWKIFAIALLLITILSGVVFCLMSCMGNEIAVIPGEKIMLSSFYFTPELKNAKIKLNYSGIITIQQTIWYESEKYNGYYKGKIQSPIFPIQGPVLKPTTFELEGEPFWSLKEINLLGVEIKYLKLKNISFHSPNMIVD